MSSPLFVHEFGPSTGPPLLAVHGLSGHGARWERFVEAELPGFRVIAPDLRGHGRSTWNPPWRLEQFAEDLLGVMEEFGLERLPVMGNSLGGAVSVYLANLVPERVSRLVLVDCAIGLDPEAVLVGVVEVIPATTFANAKEARASQVETWPFATDQQLSEELTNGFIQTEDGRWQRRYLPEMEVCVWSEVSRSHIVPPASVPTLLVKASSEDFVTPQFVADCTAALGADFHFHEIEGGHMIFLEHPQELGALVRPFLEA